MYSKIDMHLHSAASDGTDSRLEIVEKIRGRGVTAFSLTDHDSIDGVREILARRDLQGLRFVPGVEFSCHTTKLCHILGYGYDVNSPYIARLLRRQAALHREKMRQRLIILKEKFDISLTGREINWLNSLNRPGKPHLARILVDRGLAEDKADAFSKYLNKIYAKVNELHPAQAVRAIKKAGGKAIWAHPLGGEGEKHLSGEAFERELQVLKSAGIDGMECFYSRYSPAEEKMLLEYSRQNGFLISGGSDYHGKNKNIAPGQLNNRGLPVAEEQITLLNFLF